MGRYLLGLDCGHTVTKAVLFDLAGKQISSGKGQNEQLSPHPTWQERSMEAAIDASVTAIKAAIAGVDSSEIIGIGICGHSDGLYLLNKEMKPLRNAIFATDNRAKEIAERLAESVGDRLLQIIGQFLFPASPGALLLWMKENESEIYQEIGAVLHCKDWIRAGLTGVIGTEVSDASGSVVDMRSHQVSDEVLELLGLTELRHAFSKPNYSQDVVGGITEEMATRTGLRVGTPVIAGAHDVHAAAIGIGAYEFGTTSLIFGTWSINQVFAAQPIPDNRWHTRASVLPGRWLHMSTSPASASNANWFWNLFNIDGLSGLAELLAKADRQLLQADRPLYLPFLFGGPAGTSEGAHLIGARGWHTKEDIAASVIEGVVFNHKHHFDMLSEKIATNKRIIATGGSMQSQVWAQLVADIFNSEIEISDTEESGARGVAMLVGVAHGIYSSIEDAITEAVGTHEVVTPNPNRIEFFQSRYEKYRAEAKRVIRV